MRLGPDGHYHNAVMAKFKLVEEIEARKTKETMFSSDGVIMEVAEAKCGGPEKLRQALARGAVKMQVQGGVEMFTFPSVGTRVSDQKTKKLTSLADTAITADQHQEMKDCVLIFSESLYISPSCLLYILGLGPQNF